MKTGGCPRCGGDIFMITDIYGTYLECLQCGRTSDRPGDMLKLVQERSQYGKNIHNANHYQPRRAEGISAITSWQKRSERT